MSFRDRPEYQQWREDVFRLFGERCIRCGHQSNLHAHHVRPVNTYPELAFDPKNGVPLCGNCHTGVAGNEMAYVQDLETRQQQLLDGTGASQLAKNAVTEEELRCRAEQDPGNADVVAGWFYESTDSPKVIDYYNTHRTKLHKTATIYAQLAVHLRCLNRHADAIRAADAAADLAMRDGTADKWRYSIAAWKSDSLVRLNRNEEAVSYLQTLVNEFPDWGGLHYLLSITLLGQPRENQVALDESVKHAVEAARLSPRSVKILQTAALVTGLKKDYAASFKYANAILAVAADRSDKIIGHLALARVFGDSGIYDDATRELRQVLDMAENDVRAMSYMAHCFYMADRPKDALRMATRCLLVQPDDEICLHLIKLLKDK